MGDTEGSGKWRHQTQYLKELVLVEVVKVIFPLTVFLQQQVVKSNPDLSVQL